MLIASIAVISSRVHHIPAILGSLEAQVRRPDKVLLYYSSEPWHHDQGMSELKLPPTSLDVETRKVANVGSCRKYLFTIEEYRDTDASVVLIDDDILLHPRTLTLLYNHHSLYGQVVATRGWSVFEIVKDAGNADIFRRRQSDTVKGSDIAEPTEVIVTSSGSATMFRPMDVDNRGLQESYMLHYSDEIFLAAMLRQRKFVVPMPNPCYERLEAETNLFGDPRTPRAKALQARLLSA